MSSADVTSTSPALSDATPRASGGGRAPAVIFALACAWALLSPLCTRDAPVDDAAITAAVQRVAGTASRTFVLVHPPWRTDVLDALRKANVPRDVGLALPPDAFDGRRPVALLRWPHAPMPGAVKTWSPDETVDLGAATLLLYHGAARSDGTPAPTTPTPNAGTLRWNAEETLRTADVKVTGGGRTVACNAWDADNQRWVCPGMNEWNYVGPRVLTVDGMPRKCLWAHPVTGAALVVRFAEVPAGTLTLGTALHDGAAGAEGAAEVQVQIEAGGGSTTVVHPNAPGWKTTTLRLPAAGPMTFTITTPHDGARHFCLAPVVTP